MGLNDGCWISLRMPNERERGWATANQLPVSFLCQTRRLAGGKCGERVAFYVPTRRDGEKDAGVAVHSGPSRRPRSARSRELPDSKILTRYQFIGKALTGPAWHDYPGLVPRSTANNVKMSVAANML